MLTPQYAITTAPQEADQFFGLPHDFLRLDSDQEANTVELLLESAVEWAETYTARVLRITSFTARFPFFLPDVRPMLKIRRSPLIDIQAVRISEQGNATPTTPVPTLVVSPTFGHVAFPKGDTYDLDPDVDYPIEIDFRAGYSSPGQASPEIVLPNVVRARYQAACQLHVREPWRRRGRH